MDFDNLTKDEKLRLASDPNISPETLTHLAKDEDWLVRSGVAINPNTPLEILYCLAEDKSEYVRALVAANPNTPQEILIRLASDEDWRVLFVVGLNPSTPPELTPNLCKGILDNIYNYFESRAFMIDCLVSVLFLMIITAFRFFFI